MTAFEPRLDVVIGGIVKFVTSVCEPVAEGKSEGVETPVETVWEGPPKNEVLEDPWPPNDGKRLGDFAVMVGVG